MHCPAPLCARSEKLSFRQTDKIRQRNSSIFQIVKEVMAHVRYRVGAWNSNRVQYVYGLSHLIMMDTLSFCWTFWEKVGWADGMVRCGLFTFSTAHQWLHWQKNYSVYVVATNRKWAYSTKKLGRSAILKKWQVYRRGWSSVRTRDRAPAGNRVVNNCVQLSVNETGHF